MKLKEIISKINYKEFKNAKDMEIEFLCHDSKCCEDGALFICLHGEKFNGEDFVSDAISNGAIAIVAENYLSEYSVPQIIVDDARIAMTEIARVFYDYPDNDLKIVSVVGTNGKTTTSMVLCKILEDYGKRVGVIGTNGVYMGDLQLPSELTTPDPIELYYTLDQMRLLGFEYVIMEASAHAIYLRKLYKMQNVATIFTNISNEHLDFFETMEEYSNVKMNYVNSKNNEFMVINIDDEYGRKIVKDAKIKYTTYGIFNPASTFAIDIKTSMKGSSFICNSEDDIFKVQSKLVGDFNIYNMLGAIACAKYLGVPSNVIVKALSKMNRVDGRFNVFEMSKNRKVIVDFAHTPDGFDKTLGLIKKLRKGKIITLFGCVGYSDSKKRKEMGEVASLYSDRIVITTDNPKNTDFNLINSDIIKGINASKDIDIIYDRKKAIEFAMGLMKTNDTLVLLGKGAEKYQKVDNSLVYYNELEFVGKIIDKY